MKLFKSTIWAAVAVAAVAGFSACSDDNDYNAPAAPDGIYFPNDLPAEFEVQNTATSFEIEMYRLLTNLSTICCHIVGKFLINILCNIVIFMLKIIYFKTEFCLIFLYFVGCAFKIFKANLSVLFKGYFALW